MSFKKSLDMGELGAILYHEAHDGKLEKLDGFKCDFREIATGKGIELKSDFWCMDKTPNMFFEKYSNLERGTPGGPWRSIEDGADLFVYFYVKDLTFYQFETKQLVEALEKIVPGLTPTNVPNPKYTTQGYRVPRSMLEGLAVPRRIKVKLEDE